MRRNTIILSIIALVCLTISGCQQKTSSYLNDAEWEIWFAQMENQQQAQNTNPDFTGRFAWCDALDRSYSQSCQDQTLACCKAPEATWIVHSNQANLYCTDLELANGNGQ